MDTETNPAHRSRKDPSRRGKVRCGRSRLPGGTCSRPADVGSLMPGPKLVMTDHIGCLTTLAIPSAGPFTIENDDRTKPTIHWICAADCSVGRGARLESDEFARAANLNRLTVRNIFQQVPRRLHNATVGACARALGLWVVRSENSPWRRCCRG